MILKLSLSGTAEAAKKLVQSGAIKVQAQGKDQGFKRATSSSSTSSLNNSQERIVKKMNLTPNAPSPSILNQINVILTWTSNCDMTLLSKGDFNNHLNASKLEISLPTSTSGS